MDGRIGIARVSNETIFKKLMINIERESQKVKRKMENESERRKWNGEERWKQNGFQPLKTKQ